MTTALNNMGAAYYELGDYEQALQHNTDALRIAEEVGDLSSIAASSINTGNVLVKLNNHRHRNGFQNGWKQKRNW